MVYLQGFFNLLGGVNVASVGGLLVAVLIALFLLEVIRARRL